MKKLLTFCRNPSDNKYIGKQAKLLGKTMDPERERDVQIMRFVYGRQEWATRRKGQENGYLLTNGLGGFSCASMINSNTRNDHALLMASLRAPNLRYNMVNRLEESLKTGGAGAGEEAPEPESRSVCLSSQEFTDETRNENGYRYLNCFVYEDYPEWTFQAGGVEVVRRVAMAHGKNLTAVEYRIENRTDEEAELLVTPHMQFVPKGQPLKGGPEFVMKRCAAAENYDGDAMAAKAERRCAAAENHAGGAKAAGAGRRGEAAENLDRGMLADKAGRQCGAEPGAVYEIAAHGLRLYCRTNGTVKMFAPEIREGAYYAYDACDGRESTGRTCVLCEIAKTVPAHDSAVLEILYNTECEFPASAEQVMTEASEYRRRLRETAAGAGKAPDGGVDKTRRRTGLRSEAALHLAVAADQFISERESTGGKTILAGYPFFEDWGRDTMIALEGCCMSTGQLETAGSILRTFAAYCRKGLMPNLFPEGSLLPRYNTADAALLFINSVYAYVNRTGDLGFVREMWPVMTQIIEAYRDGTDYGIRMDEDGLIRAGLEHDQVTWMDVCVDGHLPTPRHGKPVEINAYWYNALKVMEKLGGAAEGESGTETGAETPGAGPSAGGPADFGRRCGLLAERTKESFRSQFWMEDRGCLRDVISGTKADEQFRCNQIWAVSMPFSMMDREQERRIVDAVYEKLYTPYGLRTLDADDAEFHGTYGGELRARDLAYHQGTVWVFPMGAYYLAYLKTRDYAPEAVRTVRRQLEVLESAMREGCIGQLPEIYDGENPTFSRGCFAQAWSVGEILRVYEILDRI